MQVKFEKILDFINKILYNKVIRGCIWLSTVSQKHTKRVVDGCFGHYKKAELNLNADNTELAYAA